MIVTCFFFFFCPVKSLGGNIVSAYPNSDLNPLLAAGSSKVSVISKSMFNRLLEDSKKLGFLSS